MLYGHAIWASVAATVNTTSAPLRADRNMRPASAVSVRCGPHTNAALGLLHSRSLHPAHGVLGIRVSLPQLHLTALSAGAPTTVSGHTPCAAGGASATLWRANHRHGRACSGRVREKKCVLPIMERHVVLDGPVPDSDPPMETRVVVV